MTLLRNTIHGRYSAVVGCKRLKCKYWDMPIIDCFYCCWLPVMCSEVWASFSLVVWGFGIRPEIAFKVLFTVVFVRPMVTPGDWRDGQIQELTNEVFTREWKIRPLWKFFFFSSLPAPRPFCLGFRGGGGAGVKDMVLLFKKVSSSHSSIYGKLFGNEEKEKEERIRGIRSRKTKRQKKNKHSFCQI